MELSISFYGCVFNFRSKVDLREEIPKVDIPIRGCTKLPYGVYRRIWHALPIFHETFFPCRFNVFLISSCLPEFARKSSLQCMT